MRNFLLGACTATAVIFVLGARTPEGAKAIRDALDKRVQPTKGQPTTGM